jgi:hypothetical protein
MHRKAGDLPGDDALYPRMATEWPAAAEKPLIGREGE